jgi:hypothetical protein
MAKPRATQGESKGATRPGRRPINWGTAKDVVQFDKERTTAVAKAAEAFARLLAKSNRSDAASFRTRITPWLLVRYAPTDRGA